jgi:6,7-dimethyl-8-ribityllumazine synthase
VTLCIVRGMGAMIAGGGRRDKEGVPQPTGAPPTMRVMLDRSQQRSLPVVGVVVSRYNDSVTSRLLDGALGEYARRGGNPATVVVAESPGSFELPVIALALLRGGRARAVAALGCIIRGETEHHRYLGDAVAQGLMSVAMETGSPVGFGVLTVDSVEHAMDRCGGAMGNKGAEAMGAVLDALAVIDGVAGEAMPRLTDAPDKARRIG